MKKTNHKIQKEILFYAQKLPPIKQMEALDFIRWLWINIGKGEEKDIKLAVSKMREIQSKHKACEGWNSVKEIRRWRESH